MIGECGVRHHYEVNGGQLFGSGSGECSKARQLHQQPLARGSTRDNDKVSAAAELGEHERLRLSQRVRGERDPGGWHPSQLGSGRQLRACARPDRFRY